MLCLADRHFPADGHCGLAEGAAANLVSQVVREGDARWADSILAPLRRIASAVGRHKRIGLRAQPGILADGPVEAVPLAVRTGILVAEGVAFKGVP